jgi:hypothetical protein
LGRRVAADTLKRAPLVLEFQKMFSPGGRFVLGSGIGAWAGMLQVARDLLRAQPGTTPKHYIYNLFPVPAF